MSTDELQTNFKHSLVETYSHVYENADKSRVILVNNYVTERLLNHFLSISRCRPTVRRRNTIAKARQCFRINYLQTSIRATHGIKVLTLAQIFAPYSRPLKIPHQT